MNKIFKKNVVLSIIGSLLVLSCSTTVPYKEREASGPKLAYCNDVTGHVKGNKPFPDGGKCTCTPDRDHHQVLIKDETIDKSVSYESFLKSYTHKSIVTDLDHKACNNMCEFGPHVVLGGDCMATPTPGTLNYEQVVSGKKELTKLTKTKVDRGEIYAD